MTTAFTGSVNSSANAILCEWLKHCRKSADPKLTVRDIGDKLSSPHTLPSKIEGMKRRLDVVEFVIYCNAIGCDPREGLDLIIEELKDLP